jgi:hypothetical protein
VAVTWMLVMGVGLAVVSTVAVGGQPWNDTRLPPAHRQFVVHPPATVVIDVRTDPFATDFMHAAVRVTHRHGKYDVALKCEQPIPVMHLRCEGQIL